MDIKTIAVIVLMIIVSLLTLFICAGTVCLWVSFFKDLRRKHESKDNIQKRSSE